MTSRDRGVFRFGAFVLDPGEQRLTRNGRPVHLRPKTFAVLRLLVERHPHLVDRQAFFDAVWPEVHVTDDALSKCVKEIRKALDDDDRRPRFVRTVPKRGYAFEHPVEHLDVSGPAASPSMPPTPRLGAARPRGIAVLPFTDMSADGNQEYFCDGVAEEVLTALSRLDGLRVIARTSAFAFKGKQVDVRAIGRTLDVDVLLEGSVRRSGNRVRVTAQLVSAVDGGHIWAERYDRPADDIFKVQDDIAAAIAAALDATFAPPAASHTTAAPGVTLEAYQLFLKGRHFLNRRHQGDLERALAHFEQSLDLSPDYAAPAAAIADVFIVLGVWSFLSPDNAFARARAAAERAVATDDTTADAQLALAVIALFHMRDRPNAAGHFRAAFALGLRHPMAHAWYASFLVDEGRELEARAEANQALVMDPLSSSVHAAAGAVHLSLGRLADARTLLEKALDLDPASPIAQHLLGWTHAASGRDDAAETALRRSSESGVAASLGLLGVLHARAGRRRAAENVLVEFDRLAATRWMPSLERALIHAALGDERRSLDLVDAALTRGEPVVLSTLGRFLDGIVPDRWLAEVKRRAAVPHRRS